MQTFGQTLNFVYRRNTKSVGPDQIDPLEVLWSRPALFAHMFICQNIKSKK